MATDCFFEINQWVDLYWKQATGSGRNTGFVLEEPVIDIVVWTERLMSGWKGSRGESSRVTAAKGLTEKFSLAQLLSKDTHEKCTGWKRIDMANSFTVDTQLSSQMKKLGEKGRNKKPKIHPEIIKSILLTSTKQRPLKEWNRKDPPPTNSNKRNE